ncbi:hypothetical protein R6Q59_031687 [Mikania micrantha]
MKGVIAFYTPTISQTPTSLHPIQSNHFHTMDSGDNGILQASSRGDGGGGVAGAGGDVNPSNFFESSSFSQPLNQNPNPNSVFNFDSIWSRNPNSDPIYNLDPYLNPNPVDDPANPDSGPKKFGVTTKTPKKRTRASRRAPTTVLTTDTTNFRQMVQEFTGGITPFAGSSSSQAFSRRSDQIPSETHGFVKQALNLSNFQNQMFPFQGNVTGRENHRSELQNVFRGSSLTSLKRWRGQDEMTVNIEGVNGNSQNGVVSSRSNGIGDPLVGNQDSWSFD